MRDRRLVAPRARASLKRFEVMAFVVGFGLLLLCVEVVLHYGFENDSLAWWSPIHGVLYMLYLVLVIDLARRCRWNPIRLILVMAAGTVPFLSFVAEHYTTRAVRDGRTSWHGLR